MNEYVNEYVKEYVKECVYLLSGGQKVLHFHACTVRFFQKGGKKFG